MRKRILVLLTAAALAVSSFPVGVCADTDINTDVIREADDISATVTDEELVGTQSRADYFSGGYTITGDGAKDILSVAFCQEGRSGADLGYDENWCADFAADCALKAGQDKALPAHALVSAFRDNIIKAGGRVVSKAEAIPGDIVIYDWGDPPKSYNHVEIVYDNVGGIIYSIGGNTGSKNLSNAVVGKHTNSYSTNHIVEIIRPNYTNSQGPTKPTATGTSSSATILSGDASEGPNDNVKWQVKKNNKDGKLKLIISGSGYIKAYYTIGDNDWSDSYFLSYIHYKLHCIPKYEDAYISDVEINNGIKNIPEAAFCSCETLEEIKISNSVTSIGCDAFHGCSSLKDISIPDGVTSIEEWTFSYCSSLKAINLPNSITSIGHNAFMGCSALETVDIPSGVKSIEYSTFEECTCLESINIPDSVTVIGDRAFYECNSLNEITMPDRVTTIGEYAFSDCSSLKTIIIPDRVSTIKAGTFESCVGLKEIAIPNRVKSIGKKAFYRCYYLEKINMPDSVTSIGKSAFERCHNLFEIDLPNNIKTIAASTFKECECLQVIRIPHSVSCIKDAAFDASGILRNIYYDGTKEDWENIDKPDCFTDECDAIHFLQMSLDLSGDCSKTSEDSVKWHAERNNETGKLKLTISGSGEMKDYSSWSGDGSLVDSVHNELHLLSGFETEYIDEIDILEGVKNIGENAFYHCSRLEKIEIPDSVISIGETAFYQCSQLRHINIPKGITTIEYGTFQGCDELQEIHIPNSVKTIQGCAFENCCWAKDITIPNSVTYIGFEAFSGCMQCKEISIPESVTYLGDRAFFCCYRLEKISIPESISDIGNYEFYYCKNLEKINIPDSVTSIGYCAFCGCSSLKELNIPNNVTYIGSSAFTNCDVLTNIYYDGTRDDWDRIVKEDGYELIDEGKVTISFLRSENPTATATPRPTSNFSGDCSATSNDNVKWKVEQNEDGTFTLIISGTGKMNLLSCKSPSNGKQLRGVYGIDGILQSTYGENAYVSDVEICEGITEIDIGFSSSKIERVVLPNSMTSIHESAFWGCENLVEVNIPNSVTQIENDAFYNCKKLKNINFPSNLSTCGDRAFSGSGLTSVTIPRGLQKIGEDVFSYCSNLKEVSIPNSVTSIGVGEFSYCENLESISIPNSVTSIGSRAFASCENLKEINIPTSVTSIGNKAFECCTSLEEINIPNTITSLTETFWRCSNLERVNIPTSVTSLDGTFSGCSSLKEISVPNSVTSIGFYTFANCDSLKEISIPKSVTSISEFAFYNCTSLQAINIPDSVVSIGGTTFNSCKSLKEIHFPEGVKKINEAGSSMCSFYDMKELKTVYLPHSLEKIEITKAFQETSLTDIYYNGTKAEWDKVKKVHNRKMYNDSDFEYEKDDWSFIAKEGVTVHFLDSEITILVTTPTPTATPKPTATPIPTATPKPTATPVPTATATPIPTATPQPTVTPTPAAVKITGQVCGTGLSLKGKIGANVLLGFTDTKAVEAVDPSVVINVDGKETVLKLSEQEHYTSGKKEIYEIQTYVPAKQINEKIDLKLIDKNGNTISLRYGKKNLSSFTFSVSEITETYLTNYEQYGEKTIDLVTAIQNYCGYAQLMTGYKTETARITDKLLYISAKDLKPYATVVDKGSKIAKYAGTGLALQSDTTMQIYFKLTDNVDAYTITLDGETVTPEDCGSGLYCVELKSIPAGKLSTASELMIRKGSETYTIKASALSWAESVLSNTKGQKQTTINMAKMLYRYSQKADAYFAKK